MSGDAASVLCDLVRGLDLEIEWGMVPEDFGGIMELKFKMKCKK